MPPRRPSSQGPYDCSGQTSTGVRYKSIDDMWTHELSSSSSADDDSWYNKSEAYWRDQKASVAGMLGGLDALHNRDVAASRRFLASLPDGGAACGRVLDVGAGIGRVSKALLLPSFKVVDMLEQSPDYVRESHAFLSSVSGTSGYGVMDRRIVAGMQDFRASGLLDRNGVHTGSLERIYDVVWIQWCVIYLTDDDFVAFLRECASALCVGGYIVLKDNVARAGFVVDKDDSSVMRSGPYLKSIFTKAGLRVVKEQRQLDFPNSVFPVRMYALRPIETTDASIVADEASGGLPQEASDRASEASGV